MYVCMYACMYVCIYVCMSVGSLPFALIIVVIVYKSGVWRWYRQIAHCNDGSYAATCDNR